MKKDPTPILIQRGIYGITVLCALVIFAACQTHAMEFYQIKIYKLDDDRQEQRMDTFLEDAWLPALHRAGINSVGVFKPTSEDEPATRQIYVLTPFQSMDQFEKLGAVLAADEEFIAAGRDYLEAAHDDPPYARIESILLRSFKTMPEIGIPDHPTPASERVYELRSYQGATEKLYAKKVEMFNEGGETQLFEELGFQPVFFGEVISGPVMPNLMYLTTFENKSSQDAHWDAFRSAPAWNALKVDPQYQHTVSHIDKVFLRPTDYSDL